MKNEADALGVVRPGPGAGGREGRGVSLAVVGRPLWEAERCTGGQCHRSTEEGGGSPPSLSSLPLFSAVRRHRGGV